MYLTFCPFFHLPYSFSPPPPPHSPKGSLIPEIKGFCRDLFPNAEIDPGERTAIMNKEVTIRVRDYAPERDVMPSVLAVGE